MMMPATFGTLVYGLTLTRFMIRVLQVPQTIIVPVILVLSAVGTFALAARLFDVWVMVAFGLIGFVLRTFGYPMAPLALGIVLGDLLGTFSSTTATAAAPGKVQTDSRRCSPR